MKNLKTIITFFCLVVFSISCHEDKPCIYSHDVTAYYVDIANHFEGGGNVPVPIYKWVINPAIKVFGSPTAEDLAEISKVVSELNALQDEITLSITDSGAHNLEVHFLPDKDFPSIIPGAPKDYSGLNGFNQLLSHQIEWGIVLIDTRKATQQYRNRVIREELTQVLGLENDDFNELYPNSIFNGRTTFYGEQYEMIDKLIIQMHYSSVVKSGMTIEQTRALECWK